MTGRSCFGQSFTSTPNPIWRCDRDHLTCVGSFAELAELTGTDLGGLDPHRPWVDDIVFWCPHCGARATRVTSVIDAWFDSGAMPFAQWHYPFENEDLFQNRFPADFISEAIDQTRGWFYSLLAIATLVRGRNSYKNVVCLGLIVDAEGRKMSKSVGNVIDPWTVVSSHGADALRWYMLSGGTPWSARRLSADIIAESLRKFLLTLWNTYSFWVTYASLEDFDPHAERVPIAERHVLDRWVLAELDDAVRQVTSALDTFDTAHAGRRLDRFVDDLSNWYVRRSRRRFWKSSAQSGRAAFLTLWECLDTTARLIAPFTPFVADAIYVNLHATNKEPQDSVHLADWPAADGARSDDSLRAGMAVVRQLVTLGRSARTEARTRVRQPLPRALLVIPRSDASRLEGLESLVADELNVKEVSLATGLEQLVSYAVKPNFKALGPRFGGRVREVARILAASDAHALVGDLESQGRVTIELDGEHVTLTAEELDVRIQGREGYSLARDGAYGVALDLDLDDDLIAEGVAREAVRAIQDLRKSSGLAVDDRIELWLSSDDDDVARALDIHREAVAGEVLARTVTREPPPPDVARDSLALEGAALFIGLRKAPRD